MCGLLIVHDSKKLRVNMTTGLRRLTGASLIMGDFNDILQADDKLNGIIVKDNEVVKFVDFEHTNCLSEMKIVGRKYK